MVTELVFIGGGKMGEALLRGLLDAGALGAANVTVVEASKDRRRQLSAPDAVGGRHPGLTVTGELPATVAAAVVAVKPADVERVCRSLEDRGTERVLSIAAGLQLVDLERWCPPGAAVVRAMPNMAAVVQASATAISGGRRAAPADVAWAAGLLRPVGTVVEVPEHLLDAVTGVSGSGPAYLMLVAEAMTEAGVLLGLPRATAAELVAQTLLGAGRLLAGTGQGPEQLRASVTSPGGTTAAGLRRLEAAGARSAFIEAVAATAQRSRELRGPASP